MPPIQFVFFSGTFGWVFDQRSPLHLRRSLLIFSVRFLDGWQRGAEHQKTYKKKVTFIIVLLEDMFFASQPISIAQSHCSCSVCSRNINARANVVRELRNNWVFVELEDGRTLGFHADEIEPRITEESLRRVG